MLAVCQLSEMLTWSSEYLGWFSYITKMECLGSPYLRGYIIFLLQCLGSGKECCTGPDALTVWPLGRSRNGFLSNARYVHKL